MKGDAKVIDYLNTALKMELTASHQYILHSHILKKWGYGKLADKLREESEEELAHAHSFVERILFLGGEPKLDAIGTITMAASVKEIHDSDLEDEQDARLFYTEAAIYCDEVKDRISADLFQQITADEEGHIAWLESQLDQIDQLGEANYLQSQIA